MLNLLVAYYVKPCYDKPPKNEIQEVQNMECRRCHCNYVPEDAKCQIEDGRKLIEKDGRNLYTDKLDGICGYCAMILMCGYDRAEY